MKNIKIVVSIFILSMVTALNLEAQEKPEPEGIVAPLQYVQGDRRDPFLPLIGPDGEVKFSFNASDILIEGIVFDPNSESMALINGEFYKEGQSVGNANIISIFPDRVLLEQDSEEQVIWLREEIINNNEVA